MLENGVVVGRIFFLDAAVPEGHPWMWASGHSAGSIKRAAHGYEATREAAIGVREELARIGLAALRTRRNFSSNTRCHHHGTGFDGWARRWPVNGVCPRVWGAQFHFISEASTRAAAAHAGVTREAGMAALARSWHREM